MFVVTELLELTVFMNKTYVLAFSQIGWIAHENRRAYLFPKRICFSLRFKTLVKSLVQLNPALTDFRGPTIFFCYRWNSVIANKENKRN